MASAFKGQWKNYFILHLLCVEPKWKSDTEVYIVIHTFIEHLPLLLEYIFNNPEFYNPDSASAVIVHINDLAIHQ